MQLYTEQDFAATKKKLTVRAIILAALIICTAVLDGLFVSVLRNRIAVIVTSVVGACLSYAYLAIKVMPWFHYWAYQNDMRHGMSRETDAWFVSCTDSTRLSDGVAFHEFIVRVGDGEDDERLFFWDDDKELPDLVEGQKLHIRSFGNYITELTMEG
ncbi:MAG: hypothetical protein IJE08_14005 [Clostridia bacterium]|nr:hypothetical protein [Clostridia bacterium]